MLKAEVFLDVQILSSYPSVMKRLFIAEPWVEREV